MGSAPLLPLVVCCAMLTAVCLTHIARAQTSWERTYGGAEEDWGSEVQQTTDGGYVIAGQTYSFGAGWFDVYLVKIDAQGDTLWTKTYGGPNWDDGFSVQQTADGGYIVAGSYSTGGENTTSTRAYLVKTNSWGETLWTRTYVDGSTARSVRQTTDGGYIMAGRAHDAVFLLKTDAQGDTLWTRAYANGYLGRSVQQTADGGYVVAGRTLWSIYDSSDIYLLKTDARGDSLWTRAYGGAREEGGSSVRQTLDGGYVVAGNTQSFGPGTPTYDNIYVVKTTASGDTLWTKTYGGAYPEWGCSVQLTNDGGYVISGMTCSFGPGSPSLLGNFYLVKTDASGDTLWTRAYGGIGADDAYSAQQTTDDGYIVAGNTNSFGAGNRDIYLIKTDSLGNVGVVEESPRPHLLSRKLAATVIRNLPENTTAYDAMGRRCLQPKPGIHFLRTEATAAPRKVLLVK